jgi:hypothetical protein
MYSYSNLKIATDVADNFRKYAKVIGKKHSDTLQLFLDFFEKNNVQPTDEISGSLITLENKILQRIDAMIKIIRGIEKEELKRDGALKKMLYELTLQQVNIARESTPQHLEVSSPHPEENQDLKQYQNRVKKSTEELLLFFDKIEKTTSHSGAPYYKVETNQNELTKLKRIVKSMSCI